MVASHRTQLYVEEILVEEGIAKGVKVAGKNIFADLVVSNAHSAHTYKDLIKPEFRRKYTDKKVLSGNYSMSAFLSCLSATAS